MEPTNQERVAQEVAKLSQVIQIDEGKIQEHQSEVVRSTVEETLNAMLEAEADRLCRAERYERTENWDTLSRNVLILCHLQILLCASRGFMKKGRYLPFGGTLWGLLRLQLSPLRS